VTGKEKQKQKKNRTNLFSLLYLLLARKDWATASAGIRPKLFLLSPLEPPDNLERLRHVSILPPATGTETNGSRKYLTYLSLMGSTLATFTEQNGSRHMSLNSGI
jgi:hypothetical protein